MKIETVTCEYQIDPLGIDNPQPRLSWALASDTRGAVQVAWQVLAASSPDKLAADEADKWDSGRVESDRSVNVPFGGAVLTSGERCWWKVRVWDATDEVSDWSSAGTFEMGLLSETDWLGSDWIAADTDISSPLLRNELTIDAPVARARVYVCGLGYCQLHINGQTVSDRVMDPAPTWYDNVLEFPLGSRVLYVTHDVTSLLTGGANAVGVMLGHGWYSADSDKPEGRQLQAARPILRLMMIVELTDGRTLTLGTDTTWKTSAGPVTANDICAGETHDARLEQPGWDTPGFDDSAWARAEATKAPSGKLVAQPVEPIRVVQHYKPTRVFKTLRGTYIFDMGQYISGFTEIRVSGPAGTTVALEHAGRVLYDLDKLDTRNNNFYHVAPQTDTYTLKGDGVETYRPRFTVHGFRYVEVTGWPGEPTLDDITGCATNNDIEPSGTFTCDNELINSIHRNVCMTFRGSYQGIPQDAADRAERVAWLGDPGFVAEDYMVNFFDVRFWSKWLDDIADAQKEDGALPYIAPPNWGPKSYSDWPCWECSYTLFAWFVYQYYDDPAVLEKHYEGLCRQLERFRKLAGDGLCPEPLGDHMEPQVDGSESSSFAPKHTPANLTGTAYFQRCAWIVSEAARILGHKADHQEYSRLAEHVKTVFNEEYFDYENNTYATGSQTANALALYLGLVPPGREDEVMASLTAKIEECGGHLATGIIGTDALEQALPTYGRADVMYTIATQTTFPSWGFGVSIGQTTIAECFDCCSKHSVSMKMFGSCEKFFYRDIAGLGLAGPGYGRIDVRPKLVDKLGSAEATMRTVRGPAAVAWQRTDSGLTLNVMIPVGSSATVTVPTRGQKDPTITESDRPVWTDKAFVEGIEGVGSASASDEAVTFDIGSGTYTFKLADL